MSTDSSLSYFTPNGLRKRRMTKTLGTYTHMGDLEEALVPGFRLTQLLATEAI